MTAKIRHLTALKLRAMTALQVQQESQKIEELILQWPVYQQAQVVAGFFPTTGEPQIKALLSHAMTHKKLLLPKVLGNGLMEFHPIYTFDALRPGAFGLMEPAVNAQPWLGEAPDLILVPGMAFNAQGERIGKGGGYYDRYLAKTPESVFVGLGFSLQMLAGTIPQHPHDVRMNYIVSPMEIRKI